MAEVQTVEVVGQKTRSINASEGPDSYNLEEVYIITATSKTNLKGVMVEMSYYEDIFKGTTSGSVLINDSLSLIDTLGLTGFEYLKLKFSKTKISTKNETVEKYFRIYRVSERILNNNGTQTYTLNFCSEELLLSEQTKISKAYPGKKISDIVTDILQNTLRIDENRLLIEETNGSYDFVIPYKKPFETINWLSTYARPVGSPGSDFMFFESKEGFNFYSLQKLFKQTPYTTYYYTPRNLGNIDFTLKGQNIKSKEFGRNLMSIKSYSFLDTFDSLYGTVSGAFANKLISIDPLTRTHRETNFNYSDYFSKAQTLNKNRIVPDLNNRLGKKSYESYEAVLKVVTSNSNQKKAAGISDTPWSVANDIFVETYIPNRTAQIALSHYSRIKLAVSGDPNLSVGMTIQVYLPSNKGPNAGYNTGQIDTINSGKYMISAIRHTIDVYNKYETVLEVVKDSYASSINASTITNFTDLKKAIEGTI